MLKIVFMFDIKGIKQVSRYHSNFQNINIIYIYIYIYYRGIIQVL